MSNKIKFGLKNVHYAKLIDTEGVITYATPKRIPGAVELSLEPRGDMTEFYADDMLYYSAGNNQGYDGTLSVALLPESFLIDALGEKKGTVDGIIVENALAKTEPFALLFEFDGDKKAVRHVLYNCNASRPTVSSSTKNDSPEPTPDELVFVASPRKGDYMVKAKTSSDTSSAVYTAWYTAVTEPAEEPEVPEEP